MLNAKGFDKVINMSGGIKSWNSNTAVGPEDTGLDLFSGTESLLDVLVVAYSLEKGLHDFYQSLAQRVTGEAVQKLFAKLARIELNHQEHLFTEYQKVSGTERSREDFDKNQVADAMEGGLTTEEYLQIYHPDLEVAEEVVSLAMGIEAQALDLYQRTADRTDDEKTRAALLRIADEERSHLKQLGGLL
jgi:rubrerythrin